MLSTAQAHEVFPSIGDMRIIDGRVVFDIQANIESFVAGINLTETANTNDDAQALAYDALRSLNPADLQARFTAFWPQMADAITLTADDVPLATVLDGVTVGPVGAVEVVRNSTFQFSAALPEGATHVQMGWAPEFGTLVLRQQGVPNPYDGFLQAGTLSGPINLDGGGQVSGWQTLVDYIPVGFDHIVPKGMDHILFVLGLFFLAAQFRPLILQISLFTLAHTITLALAALGYVTVSADIVEPLIAASIVFIAVENIWAKGISPWRPFVIFGFGLLHGLGFASVLGEFGLPEGAFVPALIGFNIGVEIGQLAVVSAMFLFVWQALRVDEGENEAMRGTGIYGVLLVVGLGLTIINVAASGSLSVAFAFLLDNAALLLALAMTLVSILCIISIQRRDYVDAYRHFVAIPCSVFIAIIGAYWVLERVFF